MDKETKDKLKESFFTKLLSGDAKESSKRFLAIYTVVILGSIITVVSLYKGVDYIILLGVWLSFAATLLGYSEYNKNVRKKQEEETAREKIRSDRFLKEDEIDSSSDFNNESDEL